MTENGQTILLIMAAASAASDLSTGKIYNFVVLPALAGGFGILIAEAPQSVPALLTAVILTFLLLYPLWKAGGLGAGDIKLFAAMVPYLGIGWYLTCAALSFLIAAVFSIIILLVHRDPSRKVHLAVPVGISVMLCLLLRQFGIQSPIQL